jgi:hypothetical protein
LGVGAILVVCGLIPSYGVLKEEFAKKLVVLPWPMYNKHPVTWLSRKETKGKQQ